MDSIVSHLGPIRLQVFVAITSSLILASDVKFIPVEGLTDEIRRGAECREGDVALSRPGVRGCSVIVDRATAAFLEEFRQPKTIVDAVIRYSANTNSDPEKILDELFPVIEQLVNNHWLVDPSEISAKKLRVPLPVGVRIGQAEVLECVQLLDDFSVYRVRCKDGAFAALKIAKGQDNRARMILERESQILKRLNGEIGPKLIEVGEFEGEPYMLAEWCFGVPCSIVANEFRTMDSIDFARKILKLCRNITRTYSRLHDLGILHGDIHTRNVLIDKDSSVRLVDFGFGDDINDTAVHGHPVRGGVGFFFDPAFAKACLERTSHNRLAASSEQYSIGALLYLLVTGKHYLDFSLEEDKVMQAIVSDPMLPFSARQLFDWPELEKILARALAKEPANRHTSLREMACALDSVVLPNLASYLSVGSKSTGQDEAAAKRFYSETLAQIQRDGDLLRTGLSPAPTCSITYGAAGIAYALYRFACLRNDASIFSLADQWLHHAKSHQSLENAFYNPDFGVTRDTVGENSLYHSVLGVHAVEILICRAMGDDLGQQEGIEAFLSLAKLPCKNPDLTLGRAGILLGIILLLEAYQNLEPERTSGLLAFGEWLQSDLVETLRNFGSILPCRQLDYLGMAHGWAGLLYVLLRWARLSKRSVPSQVAARLSELASMAEPSGRGMCWRVRSPIADPSGKQGFQAGWCNGSAGHVHLWVLAHELTGEGSYMLLAERAAWNAWEHLDALRSLCCGFAGRAYALLNLFKYTKDAEWLKRARDLMFRALRQEKQENPFYHSLYKGNLGVMLLIGEITEPSMAAMPMFEREGWPGCA